MPTTRFRWLMRGAILLLVVTVLAIGLIASGVLDPAPNGSLLWEHDQEQISVASQLRDVLWLEEDVPDSAFTVRMTGALNTGEEDSGYGVAIGDQDAYLAVAVSPVGYLAIWEYDRHTERTQDNYLLQWQTWPHVNTGKVPNELWVDVAGERATVRVNREWLWEGEVGRRTGQVGLLGESFAKAAAFDFASVELYADVGE